MPLRIKSPFGRVDWNAAATDIAQPERLVLLLFFRAFARGSLRRRRLAGRRRALSRWRRVRGARRGRRHDPGVVPFELGVRQRSLGNFFRALSSDVDPHLASREVIGLVPGQRLLIH